MSKKNNKKRKLEKCFQVYQQRKCAALRRIEIYSSRHRKINIYAKNARKIFIITNFCSADFKFKIITNKEVDKQSNS